MLLGSGRINGNNEVVDPRFCQPVDHFFVKQESVGHKEDVHPQPGSPADDVLEALVKKGFSAIDLQIADSVTREDFDCLQGTLAGDILPIFS
jgi:hypothetical protein